MNEKNKDNNQSEMIIYTTEDGLAKIETTFDGDTVWLSIDQIAELFQRDRSVIGKHVRNIFKEGELQKEAVWAKFAHTTADGKVYGLRRLHFVDSEFHKEQSDLFTTSISDVCFYTDDIDSVYKTLIENHVECLSEPQYFDFRANGFGESRAFYFRDPDGIILEMMQPL